jgi:Mechanosensitive ion channel, conserved TM helix
MWSQVNDALRQSASRMLTGVASVLPGVVALLVALLLAALFGWIVRALLSRALRGVRFDERLERLGFGVLADFSPARSPALLMGQVVFWLVVLLGLLVGLAAIAPGEMSMILGRLLEYLPNVFVAILLLLIGALVARFLGRSVLIGAVNMQIRSAKLLSVGVKWLVLVLAATMALNHLSIGGEVLTLAFGILFGGIVLALSLAVGLGSKEMVQKSWERQAEKREDSGEAPLQHL